MNSNILKPGTSRTTDIFLLFFLVLLVLLFRRFDAFTLPQIWAEDCIIIFKQAEEKGISSLFIPYSGYLLITPRFFAIFFHYLNISYVDLPKFYNFIAFSVTFLVAYGLYESAAFLGIKHKIIYATWFLFMPVAPDLFMILGSAGWMTGIYMINYIFVGNIIVSNKWYYLHLFLLLVISLTHPFSFLFSPLVVLLLLMERKTLSFRNKAPYLIILFGGIVQFIFIAFIDTGFYRGVNAPPEHNHLLRLFSNNVEQIFFLKSGLLPELPDTVTRKIAAILFILFISAFIICYRKLEQKRKYLLVGAGLITFASFIKTYWPTESYVLAVDNARYYFIPFVCLGWIFIIALDKKLNSFHIIVYLCFFLLHSKQFKTVIPDKQWKKQWLEYYDHKRDVIDINPDGWKYTPDRSKLRKSL